MEGLYLAAPHGTLVYTGKKVAIAKDRPYPALVGEFILCSGGVKSGVAYGRVVTGEEGPLTPEQFRSRFDDHRVTEKEQARWWPEGDRFYLYTIEEFTPFESPLPVEVDAGVQTLMGEVHFKEAEMPWKVFKRDGKFCVYKIGADDKPVGDTLGCHAVEAEARAQQSALYAAEQREEKDFAEDAFVPFGVTSFEEVAAIEEARKRSQEEAKRRAQFHQIVENIEVDPAITDKKAKLQRVVDEYYPEEPELEDEPEGEEPTGEKAADEKGTAEDNNLPDSAFLYVEPGDKDESGKTVPRSKRHLPYKKSDGSVDLPRLRNALSRLGQPKTGSTEGERWLTPSLRDKLRAKAERILANARKEMEPIIEGALVSFLKEIGRKIKDLFHAPLYTVKVVGDYLVTFTTNAFVDREGEIFTTKSIEDFIERHESDQIKGECWYRHLPGTKFADTVYQGLAGRFLVEVHRFDDTPIGSAFKSLFTAYPTGHPAVSPEGWGCSHGYYYDPIDREDKIYEWFEKRETSVLPVKVASNPHTSMEVVPMNESSLQELSTLLGEEQARKIAAIGEELTKELEGSVAFKEEAAPEDGVVDEEVAEVETPAEEAEVEVAEEASPDDTQPIVTDEVIEAIKSYFDFDGLMTAFKALSDDNAALKARLAEVEKDKETILAEKEMNLPRWPWTSFCPSTATETQVKEGDPILSRVPKKAPAAIETLTQRQMGR